MDQNINNNQTMNNNPNIGEKTFTQEQVNAIIGERLAKEKARADAVLVEREQQFAERERQLANREALFDLKDQLKEMGLPAELLPVLNVKDKAALNTALEALKSYVDEKNKPQYKVYEPNVLQHGDYDKNYGITQNLRKAMGLSHGMLEEGEQPIWGR